LDTEKPIKFGTYKYLSNLAKLFEGERPGSFEPPHTTPELAKPGGELGHKVGQQIGQGAESRPGDRPAEACRWCRGRQFWRKADGPWVCQTCHPPVENPAERYTLPGVDPATWSRTVTPNSRHPLIPDVVREKIAAIEPTARNLGWPPELLWNANFWNGPRGLAAVLDANDEIAEVTVEYIAILKVKRDILRFRRHAA
jgi:ribosomal protein L37AE/L43A